MDCCFNGIIGFDLRLLNSGNVPTCTRWQGESIVDLTWISPSMVNMVYGWRVMTNVETLSDHNYIEIRLRGLITCNENFGLRKQTLWPR